MPFMKGRGALRRTAQYLQKGEIKFRDNVRVLTLAFNPEDERNPDKFPPHKGLSNFVFWHLPQMKYNNPHVQIVTFNKLTPTPWIRAYLDNDTQVLIDCDSRTRQEIHDHMKKILGKTKETLEEEKQFASMTANKANFGYVFERQCICEIPGQVPCPGWQPLPKEMTGKWKKKMREEAGGE